MLEHAKLALLGGCTLIAVAFLQSVALGRWPRVEGALLLLLALAYGVLWHISGAELQTSGRAAWVLGMSFGLWWLIGSLMQVLVNEWFGKIAVLGLACFSFLTPWLGRAGIEDRGTGVGGGVPAWILEWNPPSWLHGSLAGQDIFHGPVLYGVLGEAYYTYPTSSRGLLLDLGIMLAVFAVGFALTRLRRRPA